MKISTILCITLIICLIQHLIMADTFQIISQEIAPSDITVGDRVTYKIVIVSDKDTSLNVTPLTTKSDHLEIGSPEIRLVDKSQTDAENVGQTVSLSKVGGQKVVREIVYPIVPYESGENELLPVSITYGNQTIKAKIMRFEVRSILPENANGIKDLKGQIDMPRNWLFFSIVGILILLISGSSLYFIKRRSEARETLTLPKIERPLHEVAYERLAQIEQMDLIDDDLMKEFYSRVSQIIRAYIGERYEINALESTSYELTQMAEIQEQLELIQDMLRELLRSSDFVKFAKYTSDHAEARKFLNLARKFVDETAPEREITKREKQFY